MKSESFPKTRALATTATLFLAFTLCSAHPSGPTGRKPRYDGVFSNGEKRVDGLVENPRKEEGGGGQERAEGLILESATESSSGFQRKRWQSAASLTYRGSHVGSPRRTSGTVSKLFLVAASLVAAASLLWQLLRRCLTQIETSQAGTAPRALSGSRRRKDECLDLGVAPAGDSRAVDYRRGAAKWESFLVTSVAVGVVLAGLGFFLYDAATATGTPSPGPSGVLVGPGIRGAKVLGGSMLIGLGLFTFFIYVTLQRAHERGPPAPGSLDPNVEFFLFWGMIFAMSAICSFLGAGGPESWLLPAPAAFIAATFAHTYWKRLRPPKSAPPEGDRGADNPVFTVSASLV